MNPSNVNNPSDFVRSPTDLLRRLQRKRLVASRSAAPTTTNTPNTPNTPTTPTTPTTPSTSSTPSPSSPPKRRRRSRNCIAENRTTIPEFSLPPATPSHDAYSASARAIFLDAKGQLEKDARSNYYTRLDSFAWESLVDLDVNEGVERVTKFFGLDGLEAKVEEKMGFLGVGWDLAVKVVVLQRLREGERQRVLERLEEKYEYFAEFAGDEERVVVV